VCLNKAGKGNFSNVKAARLRRTKLFFRDPVRFFEELISELEHYLEICATHRFTGKYTSTGNPLIKRGGRMFPSIRLNATSDICFDKYVIPGRGKTIMQVFPHVQFYDYTKIPYRYGIPSNYHLTFSRSEDPQSEEYGIEYMREGVNMAVVFDTDHHLPLPARYESPLFSHPVFDGSKSDLRFKDPRGHVIGLYALGLATKLAKAQRKSGFVVKTTRQNPPRKGRVNFAAQQLLDLFPDQG
jgi:hypothetical protein